MKKISLLILLIIVCSTSAMGLNPSDKKFSTLETRVEGLSTKQTHIQKDLQKVSENTRRNRNFLQSLNQQEKSLVAKLDSIKTVTKNLADIQASNKDSLNGKIKKTNESLASSHSDMTNRTMWGIGIAIVVLLLLGFAVYILLKRIKDGTTTIESTIDNVRKTQKSLQEAQVKLQENSVKMDNELLKIAQQQLDMNVKEKPKNSSNDVPNHSLVLKVADEIVRIELNLSRMDPNIKGYKQLTRAVERIKDNFKANDYEIVDMLGKPYNEGLKVVTNFIVDENLPEHTQIITSITKPQINYKGKMIQAAQITVSQNI